MKRPIPIFTLGLMLLLGSRVCHASTGPGKTDSLEKRRNLIICYEIKDYDAQVRKSINTIFYKLIRKGDNLIVYSPAKVYGFSQTTLLRPKEELTHWLQERMKADCNVASAGYRQVNSELQELVEELLRGQTDTKSVLNRYHQGLENFNSQRKINQPLLLKFAAMFRQTPGKNHVVVFFQKEFRPIPDSALMDTLMQNPDLAFTATEVFLHPTKQVAKEHSQAVITAFRDASATMHFAYLKPGRERPPRRMRLQENSMDMYAFFSQIAKETGGISHTNANPGEMMKALLEIFKSE